MKIIFSKTCLEYGQEGHPENPERVAKAYKFLKDKGYKFIEAKPCSEKDLLLVHSQKLIDSVKHGTFIDFDTPVLPNIYEYAKLSAGAAIQAAELASQGEEAFSLTRPPGHHASCNNVGGFCYFNNIAVAVAKLLKEKKTEKIAILDIDVHHGNGVQDIFSGNKQVLYISLHQYPLYPGTGLENKINCINFPLPAETEEKEYIKNLKQGLSYIKNFKPDMLAISAGFDTYKEEILASFKLEIKDYRKIAQEIKKLNLPCFAVLEGGYTDKLGHCVYEFLQGMEIKN